MIVPTTLMGGTLPVLSALVSRRAKTLGHHLSFLYGFNTLGAVLGTGAAGFIFLGRFTVSGTLWIAVVVNLHPSVWPRHRPRAAMTEEALGDARKRKPAEKRGKRRCPSRRGPRSTSFPRPKAVLWGIGVSGSVPSDTRSCGPGCSPRRRRERLRLHHMLVAFLLGIALGSYAYGVFGKLAAREPQGARDVPHDPSSGSVSSRSSSASCALLVTPVPPRPLPTHAHPIFRDFLPGAGLSMFAARQWANFALAFSYMVDPGLLHGDGFPLAGEICAHDRNASGRAVGRGPRRPTRSGAILGPALSGSCSIYLFGIERSLQILTLVNVGLGLS